LEDLDHVLGEVLYKLESRFGSVKDTLANVGEFEQTLARSDFDLLGNLLGLRKGGRLEQKEEHV